jgi:hypothetical protein
MKNYKEIPFCSNTPDNTHCFQAALKMILGYFWPDENYTWEELDRATAKVAGKWTWPMAGLIWLQEKGLEIIDIEAFDYEKFIERKNRYLIEEYGKAVAQAQIENSNIEQEIKYAKKLIQLIKVKKAIPQLEEIKKLMEEDYLVMVNLNARTLNRQEGYAGHFVAIKGFDEKGFILNDPGLPGIENRPVDFALFEKAWAYPNQKAKNIMAFKLP